MEELEISQEFMLWKSRVVDLFSNARQHFRKHERYKVLFEGLLNPLYYNSEACKMLSLLSSFAIIGTEW